MAGGGGGGGGGGGRTSLIIMKRWRRSVVASELRSCVKVEVAVLLVEVLRYVQRNRRFIRDGSPGRPPRLSHSS